MANFDPCIYQSFDLLTSGTMIAVLNPIAAIRKTTLIILSDKIKIPGNVA